jgi:hypothetical protein
MRKTVNQFGTAGLRKSEEAEWRQLRHGGGRLGATRKTKYMNMQEIKAVAGVGVGYVGLPLGPHAQRRQWPVS